MFYLIKVVRKILRPTQPSTSTTATYDGCAESSSATCSTPQQHDHDALPVPYVDITTCDATPPLDKVPSSLDVMAETPVGPVAESSCNKCSKLAKSVREIQKENSYLRKKLGN